MKVRAAVAHKAGEPLAVETVDLEPPRAGEVLVEIKAIGLCHTDEFTRSDADPKGLFPHVLPLERINDGFDLMHAGTSIRAVVTY